MNDIGRPASSRPSEPSRPRISAGARVARYSASAGRGVRDAPRDARNRAISASIDTVGDAPHVGRDRVRDAAVDTSSSA
jgi:hypothetical protein